VREIAAITSKRTKTAEDRRQIEKLEWFGGLYTAPGFDGPVMPTANIKRCFQEAGKVSRKGRTLTRALHFRELVVPILLDGSTNLDHLWDERTHRWRTSVVVGGNRIMRTRPQFPKWTIEAVATLIPDVMDASDLARVVALAGQIEGLGEGRVLGYGRFEGEVRAI